MSEYGEIHPPRTMFLRQDVGVIKDEEGNKYECTFNIGGSHPIIHSEQTGKWFTLSWADIVRLAIEAGIDKKAKAQPQTDIALINQISKGVNERMNQIIALLEAAASDEGDMIHFLETNSFSGEIPKETWNIRKLLINLALDLLKQQPTASEFTEKMRNFVKMYEKEIPRRAEINFLEESCVIIDASEARLKDLLEACEGLMEKADDGSADFDDPVPGSIYLKAKAAISKAKQGGD